MKYKRLLSAISFMMALSAPLSAEYVTIGTGTSSSYSYPYEIDFKYSTTQSIYTAVEMGGAKKIETIAYQVATAGALSTTQVEIYMGHTTKSYFSSSSNYENVSGMTLVYSGSPTLAASTGWEEFTLSTPFGYNGTSNLVVVVAKKASSWTNGSYYYSLTSNAQCLYRANDNSSYYGDATNYSNFSTKTERANVRFRCDDLCQDEISYIFTSDTEASVVRCTPTTGVVTIPATVTKDGKTYSVTSIGSSAFYGCSGLTSISIPSSVTSIGIYAFYGCSGLASITIPSSVTSIGYSAFYGCSSLASVTIPASVTSIGIDAFTGCTSIKEVKIEDGTTELALGYKSNSSNSSYFYGLFKDCPIETLYLGRNLSYSTHDYSSNYPGHGAPFECQSNIQSVTIGENVTSIGDYAFYGCSSLASITIPASVTSIGDYAFFSCSSLASITIPASVTSIGYSAFEGCSSLASITIPASVTSIGNNAFYNCTSIKGVKIEDGTTELALGYKSNFSNSSYFYGLFKDCPIETLYLGRNLSYSTHGYSSDYPGYGAPFECQSNIQSVTIGENVTSIGDYAFYGCSSLASITIPASVTSIGSLAFDGCSSLASITIPASVTSIGYAAFENCSSLASITIPASVTSIGDHAFYGCSVLASITIPASVTSIGDHAFYSCSSLASITIPASVTSIGRFAFYGCSGLTSISIPSGVTSIGSYAFSGCTGKLTVNCNIGSVSSPSEGWFYGSKFSSVEISKDVTSIGKYAFCGNSNIQSLTIGSGVTTIGSDAFNYSPTKTIWLTNTPPSGYSVAKGKVNYVSNNNFTSLSNTKVYAYLSSMFEADGIKYVPVNPSERTCDAIDCSYLPEDSIVTIGQTVSYRNIAMTVKHVNDYVAYRNSNVKNLTIEADCDINQYAFYESSKLQKVNLNNTGNIGSYAFYGCTALQIAEISNGGNVGEQAFAVCTALQTAEISNTGNIGSQAFDGCTALQSAQISNIGDIGSQAFYGCSQLSTCTVGDAVTTIGHGAFYSCSFLPAIQLGKNIKTIGSFAFYGCSKLQEIAIPDATTSLGTSCFSGCTALTTVSTGDGVAAIPQYAFSGCSTLNAITLGEGIKSIDQFAFQDCQALEDIAIPSNVTKIGNYAFSGCKKLADVVIADRNETLTLGYNGSSKPLFSDCPLDSLYIGGKISYNTSSSYGYSPFYRNTSLRTVVITDEETEIYANEFYGCSNLQNVKIGDGVKKIGNYAFSGCSSLEAFGFGSGTQSIGLEAFSDCTALTSIATKATTPPACGTQALDDINKWDCTLYVPEASVSAYQAADQWKDFFFVSTIEGSNISDNDEFEGVHRFIRDGERFQNTLARDYDTVTYVRNFECYDWEAVYLPFSMSYDDWKEDFDVARINAFYQYDDDDNGTIDRSVLQAIKVKSGELRHNFPYLIRAKVPGAKSIDLLNTTVHTSKVTSVDCSTVSTQFTFVGTYNTLSGANFSGKNVYTLENGQLAPIAANGTVPSCRWYIEVEARTIDAPAMNAHSIHINVFEDEDEMDTAIEEISEKTASAPIYSVEGFRVDENRMDRGVFMQNGRKFIRR